MIFVTGGAGFIGSNFIIEWLKSYNEPLLNIDKLTYSGNLENLAKCANNQNYYFKKIDICEKDKIQNLFSEFKPRAIIHFAAESHVDRSIISPDEFIKTNVIGTYTLLEVAKNYFNNLDENERKKFKFVHISTDEVYGSLGDIDSPFNEENRYSPNSPYSATKAGSDHLVRAYYHTYKLPVITTNCSNNYGPYQFPEKLIPLTIHNALSGKTIPIYGDGKNVRDWLYVADHCSAIRKVLDEGLIGEVYNIGGNSEKKNLEVVEKICEELDLLRPKLKGSYKDQITFINDRPGHDRRYAIDSTKIKNELGWKAIETFETGIKKTIEWYVNNNEWVTRVTSGAYQEWISSNYKTEGDKK